MSAAAEVNHDEEGLCQSTTFQQVRQVLLKHVRRATEIVEPKDRRSEIYWTEKFEYGVSIDTSPGFQITYSPEQRQKLIQDDCDALHGVVQVPLHHAEQLDTLFSANLESNLCLEEQDYERITRRAWSILKRMPATPSPLPDQRLAIVPSIYFTECGERTWEALRVVSFVQNIFLQLVLHACVVDLDFQRRPLGITGNSGDRERFRILDCTAEMIDYCSSKISAPNLPECSQASWLIVRAYLWGFWQRLKTLHLYVFYASFQCADLEVDATYLSQRNFLVSPGRSLARLTYELSETGRTSNMCTWILNLVRTEPYSFGLDFRLFHQRYGSVLGQEPARCLKDSPSPCNGSHSNDCLRFYGASIPDQSAHDADCRLSTPSASEHRLPWNQESFLRIQGARAVTISDPASATEISYCSATDRTMAISHVWSHGQGGRPEDGINSCLHQRYCHIATELGCDSYWMDTTCIPNDHDLRQEAIMQINGVFSTSRVVLVCDKDLMKIDIKDFSTPIQESILAATLMSDWNSRAWTLLESTKGRNNIFLLCKNKRTVNFRDLLRHVLSDGRIDMAVFIWHIYHMLPVPPMATGMGPNYQRIASGASRLSSEIGSLLSYRPASRPGDDFVIWSLLGDPSSRPCSSAVSFWKSQAGKFLSTGYLMSSAKRLRTPGFSWAPESPYVTTRDQRKAPAKFHRPTDARATELGTILADGFVANWLAFEFGSSLSCRIKRSGSIESSSQSREIYKIRSKFLRFHQHGLLLRPFYTHATLSSGISGSFSASTSEEGTLIAICGSNKITRREFERVSPRLVSSNRWIWKGLYQWPDDVPLPSFKMEGIWIN